MKIATATFMGSLAFLAAFFPALIAAPSVGAAQQAPCNPRADVLGHLAQKYQEVPVAIGVTNKGGLVEVLSTGDGKTWTIIISSPTGQSCMVAAGEGWRALPNGNESPDGPQA